MGRGTISIVLSKLFAERDSNHLHLSVNKYVDLFLTVNFAGKQYGSRRTLRTLAVGNCGAKGKKFFALLIVLWETPSL